MTTHIYKITFLVRPLHDIILPSVTSRLTKQVLVQALLDSGDERCQKVVEMFMTGTELYRMPFKPIRVTFLYRMVGDRREFIWSERDVRPIIRAGESYYFDVVLFECQELPHVHVDVSIVAEILTRLSGEFAVFSTSKVEVEPRDLVVLDEEQLTVDKLYDTVIVEFKTPTLLQYPKYPKFRDLPTRNTLYPQPMLTILSIINKWNRLCREHVSIAHALYAPYELIEVSHYIRPVTIRFRKVNERGFVGWIKYGIDAKSEKRWQTYLKLFRFAEFSGIGRSTAIGLGQVEVQFTFRSST